MSVHIIVYLLSLGLQAHNLLFILFKTDFAQTQLSKQLWLIPAEFGLSRKTILYPQRVLLSQKAVWCGTAVVASENVDNHEGRVRESTCNCKTGAHIDHTDTTEMGYRQEKIGTSY